MHTTRIAHEWNMQMQTKRRRWMLDTTDTVIALEALVYFWSLSKCESMKRRRKKMTTTTHHLFSKSLSHTNTIHAHLLNQYTHTHKYISNSLCGRSNAWLTTEQVGNEKKTNKKRKKRNCKDNFCFGCALLLLLPQWSAADVLDAPRRDMRLTAAPPPKEK